jgi:exosortase H (IPTLxxWG-CTERM-specific)
MSDSTGPADPAEPTAATEGPETSAPAADAVPEGDGPLYTQPWVRFAVGFALLITLFEVIYQTVALESSAFYKFTHGLAAGAGMILEPFYDRVTVASARVSTNKFVVTVDYGCDGIQVCTLLMSAVLAFPSTYFQKFVGVIGGVVWMQSWNMLRVATLVMVGGFDRKLFEPVHVYVWPTALVVICLATWMAWARWTMSDDELA